MTTSGTPSAMSTGFDLRQLIKIVVYSLLFMNFIIYVTDDIRISAHTLDANSSLLDVTAAYATTLDIFAWLTLLMLFELETYLLSDEAFTRGRVMMMHGTRWVCFLFLAHTLYAYGDSGLELLGLSPVPDITSLCQLVDGELSYGSNLAYAVLSPENCSTLSTDSQFYLIEKGTVVTDTQGLAIEQQLVWIDLAEALTWLVILVCMEAVVRLQDRGITRGVAIRSANWLKAVLYVTLWMIAAYWIYRGHYMYAWDEALWILGFLAIEMNISDWKSEIRSESEAA